MVKIGIVQMKTCENKEANIAKAKIGIEECVKKGAEIVILPEIYLLSYYSFVKSLTPSFDKNFFR